jgi:curved DNA-binding protein CbpA/GGDEF domain-containing protein
MFEDFYCLLQVHPEAETEIIQTAYKRLCKKYHPDVNPSPLATERMKQINAAFEILGDERRRKAYHAEWVRNTARPLQARPFAPPAPPVRERVVYVRPEPVRYGGGTRGAYQVVLDYFGHLSRRRHREAFALVSDADKKNFSYGSFVEWQDSVSELYEIGSVQAKLFKNHPQMKAGADLRLKAEEFAVTITEKILDTGRVSEYSMNKYAVLETPSGNDAYEGWRIYLGYRDLTALTLQFRTAVHQEEARMMGVWERYKDTTDLIMGMANLAGFEKSVQDEAYRHRRYRRPFTLCVLSAALPARMTDAAQRERVVRYIGYIISKNIRPIDQAAFLGDCRFGLMLAETDEGGADKAAARIMNIVRHDIAACFDFEVDIRAGIAEYDGRETKALLDRCMAKIPARAQEVRAAGAAI